MSREEILQYVRGDIHPTLFENAVSWALDNCDLDEGRAIPHIFGSGDPVQKAFEDYIKLLLKGE